MIYYILLNDMLYVLLLARVNWITILSILKMFGKRNILSSLAILLLGMARAEQDPNELASDEFEEVID